MAKNNGGWCCALVGRIHTWARAPNEGRAHVRSIYREPGARLAQQDARISAELRQGAARIAQLLGAGVWRG